MQMHYFFWQPLGPKMRKSADILEIPATITERGQTTVPAAIRRRLALGKRDQVVFRVLADGAVVIEKKSALEADPVIGKFLAFLANNIAEDPASIRPIPKALLARVKALVEGVEVDLDAALPDDDA